MKRSVPELIAAKRDGHAIASDELRSLVLAFAQGKVPDYQLAAFAMAVFFRGMSEEEMVALTLAMRDSGSVIDLSSVPGRKVDKHSTGGVGDKVSICLAPLVAACGVPVPMVSGRGLGHTGGTLDKLEAIPGFSVGLSAQQFIEQMRTVNVAMAGQTAELAPADKKLYALRDVTATVESIPLIVASILSKKLAEGIDGLVLDVKVGRGAFMKTLEDARKLAEALVRTAKGAGKDCVALLTRMETPLGRAVGNALETKEALAILHGRGPDDLRECTLALGAEMLVMGRVAQNTDDAREQMERAIANGSAREVARRMIAAQGGDARVVDDPTLFVQCRGRTPITAAKNGFITSIDALEVGLAAVALGAGRSRAEDNVDPAVGFLFEKHLGDEVKSGDVIAWIHSDDTAKTQTALERVSKVITVGETAPAPVQLVLDRVG